MSRCNGCEQDFPPDELALYEDGKRYCEFCLEDIIAEDESDGDDDEDLDDPRHDQAADLNKPPERKPE